MAKTTIGANENTTTSPHLSFKQKAVAGILIAGAAIIVYSIFKQTSEEASFKYRFAESTWALIRESVMECGSSQPCHQVFLEKHVENSYLSSTTREKVKFAMQYVTSGEADKQEPSFVETNLGPSLHARLRSEPVGH